MNKTIIFFFVLSLFSTLPSSLAQTLEKDNDPHSVQAEKPLINRSIYQLGSSWKNQDGVSVSMKDLKGEIQLVALIYTSCHFACPLIVEDLKKIRKHLPEDLKNQVHITLFSFDSENETAETLKSFANKNHLDAKSWTILRGDADSVRDLAAVLAIKYKKWGQTDFSHSNVITLLDKDGIIKYQRTELNRDTEELIAKLRETSKEH